MSKLFESKQSRIILFIWIIGIIIIPSFSTLAGWRMPNKPSGVPDKDFNEVIMDITDWILGFVGILTLLFVIWGGIQYMIAAGNKEIMEEGKKTLKRGNHWSDYCRFFLCYCECCGWNLAWNR